MHNTIVTDSVISISLAQRMSDAYKRNPLALKLGDGKIMEQLKVEIASIQHVTGLVGNPNNLSSVQLIFGVTEETLALPPEKQVFTVMLAGAELDANGEARILENKIVDKCKPCPRFCASFLRS